MAIRGYVQPKTLLGNIHYLNPNFETISVDKQLTPLDSSLQALNPGAVTLKVNLPEVVYCDGMIFEIINTTDSSSGLLELWDYTNTTKICDISPNEKRQLICLNNEWRVYDIKTTNTISSNTVSNYSFAPSMTTAEINNVIANISKYINPTEVVNLNFEENVFVNMNLVVEGFYGGGVLNINCASSGCHTSFISSSDSVVRINGNQDITINLSDLILTSNGSVIPSNNHGVYYHSNTNVKTKIVRTTISSSQYNPPTDYPVYYINNYKCRLDFDDSRIIYAGAGIGNHGIHCTYDRFNPLTQSIITLLDTEFGNLESCVFSQGDYSISMLNCTEAMTDTATPVAMPNTRGYEISYGGTIAIDATTDTDLPNGTVAADSTKLTIPAL